MKITKERVWRLRTAIAEKAFSYIDVQKDRLFYFWEQQTGWRYFLASSIFSAVLIIVVFSLALLTILYDLLFGILEAIAPVD